MTLHHSFGESRLILGIFVGKKWDATERRNAKAIETGIILLIMDIEFFFFFFHLEFKLDVVYIL